MELKCKVQHYEWGKVGSESMVAKLVQSGDTSVAIDESKPYAELWLGTHPNGPALIIERDVLLSDYLKENEDAVGPLVKRKYGVQVPFLLKVLSIRKALSIQAHPDKKLARQLHRQFPELYKDDNHKPELAVALTPFEVLCGFRSLTQIQNFINKVPEFRSLLPADSVDTLLSWSEGDHTAPGPTCIKPVFEALLKADRATLDRSLNTFLQRLEKEDVESQQAVLYPVISRLYAEFGGEAGCWAPLLLNHFTLRPGESVFLKANLPHAYLTGDCIEIMSNSDNVVRAGLTPKHIDVPTLVAMLDYTPYTPADLLLTPTMVDEHCCQWTPPVDDFKLYKIVVPPGCEYNSPASGAPGLALVTCGHGAVCDTEPVRAAPGTALFLKANRQLTLEPALHSAPMHLYLATVNLPTPTTTTADGTHNGLF